jgi:general secretion pathway protein D
MSVPRSSLLRSLVNRVTRSAFVGLAAGVFAAGATAQTVNTDGDDLILQFDEVEGTPLDDFIKYCQIQTGIQLHYNGLDTKDTKLRFIGKKRIPAKEFWSYFQAVLKSQDFVMVPYGNIAAPGRELEGPDTGFFAIRKSSGSASNARPGYIKTQAPVVSPSELDQFKYDPGIVLTTSFPLKYVNAQEATNTLNAYFTDPQLESVRAVTNSNTLVMTGFAQTLAQMQRLIELLDTQPAEYKPLFGKFELKYAVAEEIKPIVDQLIAAERGEAQGARGAVQAAAQSNLPASLQEPTPHVEPDARTNALYVIAAAQSLDKIGQYIRLLDTDVDPRGDTHVYRLKNSAAKDLEEILNDWAQQSASGGRSSGGATAGGAGATTTGGASSLEQPVTIVADEASNSLVISASKSRYAQVLEVIKRLDVRRRQVLIESALVEISGTSDFDLGVELGFVDLTFGSSTDDGGFGLSNFGLSELEDLDGDGFADRRVPLGLGPGASGAPGVSGITAGIFGGDDFQIPIVLKALGADTDANVLSMPSVLVNDNEKATIKTIDERPSFTVSQGQVSDQTSFKEYVEAGIQLDISPSISAGNYLRLNLKLEVSAFLPGDTDPPPRTKRELDTAVTLPDGHTMVIGGIVQDNQRSSNSKIPFLGDFPLIGWLFGTENSTDDTTNLYIFVTPHIVSDDFATLDDLSYKKKKEMETLNGKIYLVDEDWDRDNADTRILDAAVAGVFDMPSYASPAAGEMDDRELKPKAAIDDSAHYGEIELPKDPPATPEQGKP